MEVASLLQSSNSSSQSALDYPLSDQQENMLDFLQRSFLSAYDNYLAVIQIENMRYLLGVQLAKLLRRETSNLYRSLKRSGIILQRASSDQVRWINSLNLCFVQKTHSITFVPLREAIDFLTEEFRRRKPAKAVPPYSACSTVLSTRLEADLMSEQSTPSHMLFSFSAQPSTPSGSVDSQSTPLNFKQYSLGMLEEAQAQSYITTPYQTAHYGHQASPASQQAGSSAAVPYVNTLSYTNFNIYNPQGMSSTSHPVSSHPTLSVSHAANTAGRAPASSSSFSDTPCAPSALSFRVQQPLHVSENAPSAASTGSNSVGTALPDSSLEKHFS